MHLRVLDPFVQEAEMSDFIQLQVVASPDTREQCQTNAMTTVVKNLLAGKSPEDSIRQLADYLRAVLQTPEGFVLSHTQFDAYTALARLCWCTDLASLAVALNTTQEVEFPFHRLMTRGESGTQLLATAEKRALDFVLKQKSWDVLDGSDCQNPCHRV